jgi:hypothetical protein
MGFGQFTVLIRRPSMSKMHALIAGKALVVVAFWEPIMTANPRIREEEVEIRVNS